MKSRPSQIFAEAVEIADAEKRAAYIKTACGSNTKLMENIGELIDHHTRAEQFLNKGMNEVRANVVRQFGDFVLLEEIARGGMGIIYRARQVSLDRIVAVKVILSGHFASREELLRFHAEAEAAAHLRHPNIVTVHSAGEYDGRHFFSMDYVEGSTLADFARSGPLAPKRAAAYVRKIAEAIHYAHEQGVLHRDLKPSNILVDERDEPLITDFGLAKREQKDPFLTLPGQVFGSPNFMPPEQADGSGKSGRYSDVYALGSILFYLLTARPPFVAPTVIELIHHVLTSEPVSPALLNPNVPQDAATVCLKCLEKNPAKRYESARLVAEDLGRFIRDEPVLASAAVWTDFNRTFWSTPGYAGHYLNLAGEMIPARQYLFYVVRSFLAYFAPKRDLRICDLGCGDGALAQQLKDWRAGTHITLVDGSSEMLEAASGRLVDHQNVHFVRASFDEVIKGELKLAELDVVVSSFAIHHLTPTERLNLFCRVSGQLIPGGWFLNLDVGLPDEPEFIDWQFELWREWLIETDKLRTPEESLRHLPEVARENPDNKYGSVGSQLKALRSAGFSRVDCLYRNSVFTLYCGQKPLS